MRLLVVTHYFPEHRSGVERIAHELATRLADGGWEVTWAASAGGPAEAPDRVRRIELPSWNVLERTLGISFPLWGPLSLFRLAWAVARTDMVHLHDCLFLGNIAAYLCAKLLGRPIVVTQHIGVIPFSRRWMKWLHHAANWWVGSLVLAGSDRVVFYSRRVEEYFKERVPRLSAERIVRIPNGVDTDRFFPADNRAALRSRLGLIGTGPVLLFVGRFVEKKGLSSIRAAAGAFPNAQWVMVGWGHLDPASWGLANVTCVGALSQRDIVPYYQAADLLVLPSVGEGFPLVAQEAMACGTPALLSREIAEAMPEIEGTALLCDPDPISLVEALRGVSRTNLERRRDEVFRFARRQWSWRRAADGYSDTLEYVGLERGDRLRVLRRLAFRLRQRLHRAWNRLRAPWLSSPYREVVPFTMVGLKRLRNLEALARELETQSIAGDIVECGCWNGGSGALLALAADKRHVWLLDSFEGLPPSDHRDGLRAAAYSGELKADPDRVHEVMSRVGVDPKRYTVVRGWFEETIPKLKPTPIALLHVDADWYASVRLCLDHLYDRVAPGGYVVLDDFGYWEGCRRAWRDFLAERGLDERQVPLVAVDETAVVARKPLERSKRASKA